MSESSDYIDVTGDGEPTRKEPKLITGFFVKFDANNSAHVAAKAQRERNEAERKQIPRSEAKLVEA